MLPVSGNFMHLVSGWLADYKNRPSDRPDIGAYRTLGFILCCEKHKIYDLTACDSGWTENFFYDEKLEWEEGE
jgi:hypothetical protein